MKTYVTSILLALAALPASSATVSFEGLAALGQQTSMSALGISNSYLGNVWRGSNGGAWGICDGLCFGDQTLTAHTGTAYAWTSSGPRSLFIDFGVAIDFSGGYFAGQFDNRGGYAADSIQFLAYDASQNLIGSTVAATIIDSQWTFVGANFSNVSSLEIRSDRLDSWFAVDDLQLSVAQSVPEPTSLALFGVSLLGLALSRRKSAS